MRTGSKNAFGQGVGLAHEFGLAMDDERVTPQLLKQVVSDPIRKAIVGAAIRGEVSNAQIGFEDLLAREISVTGAFCEIAGIRAPGHSQIEQVLRLAESHYGVLTVHHRFVPAGLMLPNLFNFFYNFNNVQEKEQRPGLKLYHEMHKEWWRSDRNVENLATNVGVMTWDFNQAMQPTDLVGRPFYLTEADQIVWAKEQGGDGFWSAEETLYAFARSVMEFNRPLWGAGSMRCRNACGSGYSLGVCWDADYGLYVFYYGHGEQYWALGAGSRKYLVLGA